MILHAQRKRVLWFIGLSSLFSIVLLICIRRYYPFLSDDALISLRYVYRLLEGKGLTWTEGRPVEGYSNLLWILLTAAMGLLGVDLIVAVRLLGVAMMIGVIFVVAYWRLYRDDVQSGVIPLIVGLFFFSVAAPTSVWAIGGLEQPLFALLIAIAIPLVLSIVRAEQISRTTLLGLSLALGMTALTRPDGILFSVAALLSIYLGRYVTGRRRLSVRELLLLLSMPILFYGAQLVFRLIYYGEWVPNTALVKISPSIHHLLRGVFYVGYGFLTLFPFSFFAGIFIIIALFDRKKRGVGLTFFVFIALWAGYVIFIGGDIFPAHRHILPILVVLTYALIEGADWVLSRWPHPLSRKRKFVSVLVLMSSMLVFVGVQFFDPMNQRAITERWEWDCKILGETLNGAFWDEQPLVAVTAAGCLPYWSHLPSLDMLGLNDYYLPRHPPENFGQGVLAHELGDGAYVLSRHPDIIVFHTGRKIAHFRSGFEMQQMEEFQELYSPIKIFSDGYVGTIWLAKESPRIGIKKSPTEIYIPAYFFNANPDTTAYLNDAGKLVVAAQAGQPIGITLENIPEDDWEIEIITSSPAQDHELFTTLQHNEDSLTLTISTSSQEPIEIEAVVLRKPD